MIYALEDLLKVRDFRETAALNEVRAKTHHLDQAVREKEEKKRELAEYRVWRLEKEESLYREIQHQLVHISDLDDLKQKINTLRQREFALEQAVEEAGKRREAARQALEAAKQAYQAALKERRKIEAHKEIWREEMRKEAEFLMEKEMEDFRRMKSLDAEMEDEAENDENYG